MRITVLPLTANVLAAHKSHLQTVRHPRFRTMIKCLEKPCNDLFAINVFEIIFDIKRYVFYKDTPLLLINYSNSKKRRTSWAASFLLYT